MNLVHKECSLCVTAVKNHKLLVHWSPCWQKISRNKERPRHNWATRSVRANSRVSNPVPCIISMTSCSEMKAQCQELFVLVRAFNISRGAACTLFMAARALDRFALGSHLRSYTRCTLPPSEFPVIATVDSCVYFCNHYHRCQPYMKKTRDIYS